MNTHTIRRFQCDQCHRVFTEQEAATRTSTQEALHGVTGEFRSVIPTTYYVCPHCGCDELDDVPELTADDLNLEQYHDMIASIPVDQGHWKTHHVAQPDDSGLYIVADNIYEDVDDDANYYPDELYEGIVERVIYIWQELREKKIKQVREDVLAHYRRMIEWVETQTASENASIYNMGVDIHETWLSEYCPLCQACPSDCRYCPITHATGGMSCQKTPWNAMASSASWGEWLIYARKLYNLLETLDYNTLGIYYNIRDKRTAILSF